MARLNIKYTFKLNLRLLYLINKNMKNNTEQNERLMGKDRYIIFCNSGQKLVSQMT